MKDLKAMSRSELEAYCRALERHREQIIVEGWKGKSSFEIVEHGGYVEVIKYQKVRDGEPKPIITTISKKELECLSEMIWLELGHDQMMKSRVLAGIYCNALGIWENNKDKRLFDGNHNFIWDNFFSCRPMHNKFTLMLNVLEKKGEIKYSGGVVTRI